MDYIDYIGLQILLDIEQVYWTSMVTQRGCWEPARSARHWRHLNVLPTDVWQKNPWSVALASPSLETSSEMDQEMVLYRASASELPSGKLT